MSTPKRTPIITGGCQCGAIRYALYAMPTEGYVCHCRMFQKAVGSPLFVVAPVDLADFAWTRGSPKVYRSSSIAVRPVGRDFGPLIEVLRSWFAAAFGVSEVVGLMSGISVAVVDPYDHVHSFPVRDRDPHGPKQLCWFGRAQAR